jgi:magnesium-transporting ATPase (P-type)
MPASGSLSGSLPIGIITIASTGFTLLFGIVTIFPLVIEFVENTSKERKFRLLQERRYRFIKRLVEGRSMFVLLVSSILLICVNIGVILYFMMSDPYVLYTSAIVTIASLVFVILAILVSVVQSGNYNDEEFDLIADYLEDNDY